jgi:hypothetical protein
MPTQLDVGQQAIPGKPGGRGRPVMLATMDVPFDETAVAFAVDSAVELGQGLIVANFAERSPLPLSIIMGYDDLPYPPALAASLRRPAELARSLGINVARIRVKSFHPIQAMIETISEQDPGVFVFGPDRSQLRRPRYRRAVRAIRARASVLVWLPD